MTRAILRHAKRLGLGVLAAAALVILAVNAAGYLAFRGGARSAPADPQTGVMLGGEPISVDRRRPRACLLLHGWLTTPADFGDLPAALDEAGWDVFAPLAPGHGTSARDLSGLTAEDLLEAARRHYRDLRERYGQVALVGFSMGGAVAAVLAAEDPPDRLVLIAPFLAVRHHWYYVLPARTWQALLSPVVRWVWRGPFALRCNRPEGRRELVHYTAFPTAAAWPLFDLSDRATDPATVGRLTMPTLVVHSTGDFVCSRSAIERFREAVPSGERQRVVFERSNHNLLRDYDREAAVAAVVGFLGRD